MKIINEDLKIGSITLAELTAETAAEVLRQFAGAELRTLTAFYDKNNDMIVLNEEHPLFNVYEALVLTCLMSDADLPKSSNEGVNEVVEVIRYAKDCRRAKRIKNILTAMKFQRICPNYDEWKALVASDHDFEDWYLLGYMHGKRAERAKKRK